MAKIIGFSGAQGSGKTTTLNALSALGYKVDDFKVSRAVQEKMGYNALQDATNNFNKMVEFQNEILTQKMAREEHLKLQDGIILTDRTFADISTYAMIWAEDLEMKGFVDKKTCQDFIFNFVEECSDYQQIYSGVVNFPYMDHIKWEQDKNRASMDKIESFEKHIHRFFKQYQGNVSLFEITTKSIEDRATQVEEFLRTI